MPSRNDTQLDHWSKAVLLVVVILGSVVLTSQIGTANPVSNVTGVVLAPSSSGTNFDYLVMIIMENHGIDQIINSAPFMTSFASSYAIASRNTAVSHPSLPNYLALTGGSTFGCGGYDGDPNTNACTGTAWRSLNIVDRLEAAGLSWKAYMEDMPSNCMRTGSGGYVVRHNPFVYFNNIASNPARCSRVVPAGNSDKSLLNDLSSDVGASNFMWLTPNMCNDMHDCPVAHGDSYLSGLVPLILNSSVFKTKRAALIITFDEGNHGPPSDFVYTVFAGPTAKTPYTSSRQYDHYSLLRTIEDNWRLPTMTPNDGSASNMFEFLQSSPPPLPVSVSISWTPDQPVAGSEVNFSASATGGLPGYAYTWTFGDKGTDSGATPHHTYSSPGNYSVEVTATDSKSASATKSASVTVRDVNAPVPPVFTTLGNQSASIGNVLRLVFRATPSSPDLKLTYSIVDGPRGAIIDQESGLFSWTPTVSDGPGTYRVIVRVSDNKQATSTQTIWVVLASSPRPNLPPPSSAAPLATPATMTSSFITAIVSLAVVASGALVALGASRKLRRLAKK